MSYERPSCPSYLPRMMNLVVHQPTKIATSEVAQRGGRRQCLCSTNFIWRSTSNPKCHMAWLKTKMNVNEHLHFIPKCHLNFGSHNILGKLIYWIINMQSWIVTKKRKKKKLLVEHKYSSVLHVSSNVEDSSPIHCINFKPTKRNSHESIRGLQVQPIAAFDSILFGKILSHCLALFPVHLAISDHRLNSRLQRKLQEQSWT